MKKYIKLLIICCLSFFLSCSKDFIKLSPLDQANTENSFISENDANLAVLGIYEALQDNADVITTSFLTEIISDNTTIQPTRIGDSGRTDLRELELFEITTTNSHCQAKWTNLYKGISRANVVLDRIESISFTNENSKNQYIGESKLLRAFFYFDLVRYFGGVPVTLTELKSVDESFSLGRSTEEEVYNIIINDLIEAEALLPTSYGAVNIGRTTSGAAQTLLAKVYLTKGDPELAIPLLRNLLGKYTLMPSYADVFKSDNTAESIFEIQYTSAVINEGNPYPNLFLSNDTSAGEDIYGSPFLGGAGQGESLVTQELYEAYEPDDARKEYSILPYYSQQESDTIYIAFKYRGAPSNPFNSEDNIPILRYADVLLMLAEALNEENGSPTAEAYDLVDLIRNRSELPNLNRNLDYQGFKTMLSNERRFEFAFENHRWFDLKRLGLAEEVMSTKGYAIKPHHLLYPIPFREVEINPEVMTQNPGY